LYPAASGLIEIFGVLGLIPLNDLRGENHTDEITELFHRITDLYVLSYFTCMIFSHPKIENKTEKFQNRITSNFI